MTGSAFNIGVGFPSDAVSVSGVTKSYTVENEGRRTTREFCPTCGSPLFTRYPDRVFIKAGTIDDGRHLVPTRQIWTEMAVPWSRIPDDIDSYDTDGRTG